MRLFEELPAAGFGCVCRPLPGDACADDDDVAVSMCWMGGSLLTAQLALAAGGMMMQWRR